MINLSPEHVADKRKIGKIGESPVFLITTTGGLNLVLATKGGKFETIGSGPHPAVAKHIAEKVEPKIVWTTFSKSDYVEPAHFEFILPEYIAETNRFRAAQGLAPIK